MKNLEKLKANFKKYGKFRIGLMSYGVELTQFKSFLDHYFLDPRFEFTIVKPYLLYYTCKGNDNYFLNYIDYYRNNYPGINVVEFTDYLKESVDILLVNYPYIREKINKDEFVVIYSPYCSFMTSTPDYVAGHCNSKIFEYFDITTIESEFNKKRYIDACKLRKLTDENFLVTGCMKFDLIDKYSNIKNNPVLKFRPIYICPHHSLGIHKSEEKFSNSTFLSYYKLFLEIIEKYTQYSFIFRPHPSLFYKLSDKRVWGYEKAEAYYDRISSYPNCKLELNEDPSSNFVKSLAMITDCHSFLPEYVYTHKKIGYLMNDSTLASFGDGGRPFLDYAYQLWNESQIIEFMENIRSPNEKPRYDYGDSKNRFEKIANKLFELVKE